jgi:iron(III) transport system permease protein
MYAPDFSRPARMVKNPISATPLPRSRLGGLRDRFHFEYAVVGVVVVVIGYLVLVPLGYLLWNTFVADGTLTLDNFRRAYSAVGLGEMTVNSLWFTAGTTAVAVGLGTALAYLVVRTDLRFKPLVVALTMTQLIVPGVLYTIAWIFLASPRTGALNSLLEPLLGPGALDVFSMGGMIVVEALHLVPFVFLLMAAAFLNLDPALEESAVASGVRRRSIIRRITLPLVRPALAAVILLVGIRAIEAFEVPALLGIPGGVWVFTSRIWRALNTYPTDIGVAGAYAVSLLALTAVGVFLLSRLLSRGRYFRTVTGRGARPRPVELGRLRLPLTVATFVYLTVAAVLPLLILVYASTQPFYTPPSVDSLSKMTLESYTSVLSQESTLRALKNTVVLAAGTATVVVLLGAIASWFVVRTKLTGRWLVDGVASLPIAIPSLVLGTALLVIYLRVPIPIYGTLWILLIAFVTAAMPSGMRFSVASMQQLGDELEESARTSGASWWQTFRRVLLPLMIPGLAACWLYLFVVSARQLSSAILLYSPDSEVLAVRIWEQYQTGQFTELAALGIMMTVMLGGLIAIAYKLGGVLGVVPR